LLKNNKNTKNCLKQRNCSDPLFGNDDGMDAGGGTTRGAVAEGLGEILLKLNNSLSIPLFVKGGLRAYQAATVS